MICIDYLEQVFIVGVEASTEATHGAEPFARVNIQLVAEQTGRVVTSSEYGTNRFACDSFVDRVVEQATEHAELEKKRASTRRACVIERVLGNTVFKIYL